ncbi:MAG: phosphoribosylglycinamide formyltransferase [Cyclobacteriaceae bacterium]|nr:phosphoribosylglycinamide formyltransferase [Cyclobacteriaceae bacterium]
MKKTSINIAIFASGSGTNAQAIFEYFKGNKLVDIKCIYSNNPAAYALTRGKNFGIKTKTFTREEFYKNLAILAHLKNNQIDLIILAGFMWLVPTQLVKNFAILNIHPALLPTYGGKGMYGHFVHKAVIKNNETESGITIHYVNNEYDKGNIITQVTCPVSPTDTTGSLAAKIHILEHKHYPKTILKVVEKLLSESNE